MGTRQFWVRAGGLLLLLALIALVSLAVGCTAAQPQAKAPYKIGAILSLSGPLAPLGTLEKNGAELAVEQVNEAGGINGHKVELVILDDETDDTKAVNAMIKLVTQEKVAAVFGPTAVGTFPAMDVAKENKVPMFIPQPENAITEKGNEWVFRSMVSDGQYVARVISYLKKQGWSKLAILADSTDYGTGATEEFQKQAPAAGMTITAVEKYEPQDTDMTIQLTKIQGTNPDVIIVWGTIPGPAIIAKNARTLGITTPFIGGSGINNPRFVELAGEAGDGWLYPGAPFSVADQISDQEYRERALAFNKAYQEKYDSPPGSFGALGYDGVGLIMDIMKKAGDDPAKIREVAENHSFKGVFGHYRFSPTDHTGLGTGDLYIIRYENGKRTLVE